MKQFIRMKQVFGKMKAAIFFLLAAVTAFCGTANAQFDGGVEDPAIIKVIGIANGGLVPLAVNATIDNTFQPGFEQLKKIQNIVRLSLFEETTKYLPANFTATVQVKIEYGPNASSLNQYTQSFSVSYDKTEGTKYNAKNYFSFEGAQYVKITVQSISPASAGGVNMSDILLVENEMRVTRYFELQQGINPSSFTGPASVTNPADAVPVSWIWPVNTGNNATQLEWTWLEDELAPYYYFPNTTNIDVAKLFKDNATRIDLPYSKSSFNIPLFYDGAGKLYYRIRPVNIKSTGSRNDGQWTTPAIGAGICSYAGHNNALNWQVRTSFAEEGKLKSVMEYYDGSLRSRQTVTKENVNNTTVSAETFYDYEGRPAIQILPVPGINTVIKYQANLNLFNTQNLNQNPAEIFDLQPIASASSFTQPLTASLNNNGAAKYYSSANDELNTGPNKNIPDAEGYPYTVTRYTPDGTGRIMAQSGVGPAHKMSSGRETKYYYGSPSQEELDGLFGTEVGDKTHYFKNMVKDANGQMSVSYTDMHGRTIATALAGDAPGNLLPLNNSDNSVYLNQGGTSITRNLLDNNTNIEKGNSIESINSILVPAPTLYTFNYKLTPESLNLNACNSTPICYECLYDLVISITDESGEQDPFVYTYKNLTVAGDVDDNCNTHNPFIVSACPSCPAPVNNEIIIARTLLAGSYSVRKTLTLSESSLQKYNDLFFQTGKGICKTEQQIIDSVYSVLLSTSNCNVVPTPACQSCTDQLGSYSTFQANYLASVGNPSPVPPTLHAEILAAYNAGLQNCNQICNTTSLLLSSKRQMMLADMMPYGGQYATETPIDPLAGVSMYNKYNIFSTGFGGQPFYKNPWNASQQLDYYRNNIGEIDQVIHPGGAGYTLLNSTTKDQFTNQFVNSWADALLPHHPEFPRLLFAENTLAPANVYNWINSFNTTTTYAAATTAGYIMIDNGTITDPFYSIAPASYKNDMTTWITSNYAGSNLSLWMIARGDVLCKNILDPVERRKCYNNDYNGPKVPPFSDIITPADKDQMWTVFRSLYSAARDNQVNDYIVSQRPLVDDATLIAQKYYLRFGTNNQTATQYGGTWYPSVIGNQPPGIPTGGFPPATTQTYTSRCNGYIEQWKTSLLQCGVLANMSNTTLRDQILNQITSGMVTVCIKGSDASNPDGSSTVNPATPNDGSPRSFEEVINQVFASYGINPPKDYYCNPYVIESPKPYGKNPKFIREYTSVVDSCACARFSIIFAQASTAGYSPGILSSINTYLQLTYQDTLSSVLHEALLGCSSYHQWVCDSIQQLTTVSCYDPHPCTVECAQRQSSRNRSFEINSQPPDCAAWTFLLDCFYDGHGSTVNMQPTCQSDFVAFYNANYQANLSWAQIAALYQSSCGQVLNVCTPCTTQVLCSIPNGNCRDTFIPYYFSSPQPFPEFLKCGFVPKKCLVCDSLISLTNEFKTIFTTAPYNGGPVFSGTNLTPEQIDQNILFSRFLNFRTGFQYSWMQYAQAAATANCNPLAGGGGGVADLVVTTRSGNTPLQYIASNTITFLPDFVSGVNDNFETLIQPNGGGGAGPQVVICPDTKPLTDTTGLFVLDTACHHTHLMAIQLGQTIYQQQLLAIQANFESQYRAKCMAAKNLESFTVQNLNKEYHYTLYYYDMAGSLVKTVPPKGVKPDFSTVFTNSVKLARGAGNFIARPHEYITQYRYNSLGQVVAQNSPDATTSHFWYDRLGRLAVSQNAQQAIDNKYSYTIYDALGRITEVGQKPQTTPMTQIISQVDASLNNWIVNGGGIREQITYTGYDIPFGATDQLPNGIFSGLGLEQRNMRNRVSFTGTKNFANDGPVPPFYAATFFTYDIHGNVDTLLQDYSAIAEMHTTKRMVYNYDLISGKVNMVNYQPDWYNGVLQQLVTNTDKFFHKYKYDAENRLTEAWTSRDKIEWERDAAYNYYKHGPLNRMVIGQLQVQGVDYAYTIQGWVKGVNSTTVSDGTYDMGKDGFIGGTNSKVARDIYGFALHYFDNGGTETDYKPIGGSSLFARPNNGAFVSLFNGNIGAMSVNNGGLLKGPAATTNALPLFYNYRYDQLDRIRSMNVFKGLNSSNQWVPVSLSVNNDYGEAVNYDPNGNILGYTRNATGTITAPAGFIGGVPMDNMSYEYHPNTNRLKRVTDIVADNAWDNDINNQTNTNNYTYDAIGNLKTDFAEGITNINWTVYGKISSIIKNGNTISYTYDANGNRITKTANGKTTMYVRDGSNNVMSIYEKIGMGAIEQTENQLYGSNRIGILNKLTVPVVDITLLSGYGIAHLNTLTRGEKNYELNNHLDNVLVTISDKKNAIDNNSDGTIDYYNADVITATDYYPFGLEMSGRRFGITGRYGFNGKERDKDINSLTAYDYGYRIYNPGIAKFLSVDPLTQSFPYYTPYQFAGNNPIQNIDLDGAEDWAKNYVRWSVIQAQMQQTARENKAKRLAEVAAKPFRPVIPLVHSEQSPEAAKQARMAAMSKPILPRSQTPVSSPELRDDTREPWQRRQDDERSDQIKAQQEYNARAVANANADPVSAQMAFSCVLTTQGAIQYVEGVKNHAVRTYEGFRDNDPGKGLGNLLLLGVDLAPFAKIPLPTSALIPARLARIIPEEFSGSATLGTVGSADVFVVNAMDIKGITTAQELAKRLTLLDANGQLVKGPFRVIEFDTKLEGLAQPLNRPNPGFINGGKTAGGATEYIMPNQNLSNLNNVTQKTIK